MSARVVLSSKSSLRSSSPETQARLAIAARAAVERLEDRRLMAADPFADEALVQSLPFVLEFDGTSTTGLHDKDDEHLGLTAVQINKNGRAASYVQANLDQVGGALRITSTGNSTAGSNYNADNTLTNAVETSFPATTRGFSITTRLIGPLSYIARPSEQVGVSFGPDQDNYIKLVATSRQEGTRLQFTDEAKSGSTFTHVLDKTVDVGSFAAISTLDLRLVGDASSGVVSAYYAINGGAYQKISGDITLTGTRRNAFFTASAKAGLITAHKNNNGPITAIYDRFEIQPGSPVARPIVSSVNPTSGSTGAPRDGFISGQLNLTGGGIDTTTLNANTVKLYRTSDQALIAANVGTSGGGDVIILTPGALLDANTSYTFEVTDGLKDAAGNTFVPFSSTFTTGTALADIDPSFSFEQIALPTATGEQFTALAIGPDGKLYAGTHDGRILRYGINANGTLGAAETINAIQVANGANRLLIGLAFDPASTAANPILWVSHGQYRFGTSPNSNVDSERYADDWTGKISKLTNLGGAAASVVVTDVVKNLPRSVRDHTTNQLAFGPVQNGVRYLYVTQGSQSATGAPDTAWGQRAEHLLSAAVLRLNPNLVPAGATLDAKTEAGGTYNPYAAGAPLTIFASGVRNAYDLVWTSDGFLYAPTNGSAAGGNTPGGNGAPAITGVGLQRDFLYRIVQDGYYGHPNPQRNEFVLNGGYTPGDGVGPDESPAYGVTVQPEANYRGYAYNFGANISPNGVLEYRNTSAFGGALAGKLLVARYSGPDDVIVLTKDSGGNITQAQKGIAGLGGLVDPLDLIEDPSTGFLYVSEYAENTPSKRKLTLLRPIAPGARATADKSRLVYTDIAAGSTGGSGASAAQTITIRNTGTSTLTIPGGAITIVDDPAISGDDESQFELSSTPTLPATIAVGESVSVQVRFRAASVGLKGAVLRILSNDQVTPALEIPLRGIGTASDGNGDVGGSNEPSLQRILNAFGIPINVGDSNGEDTYDLPTPRPGGTAHDEIEMQRLVKAGAGPVVIEPLAEYAFNTRAGAVARVGYYTPGTKDARTELFKVDVSERTSTNPTWGSSFDPGSAPFGLYGEFNGSPFEISGLPRGVFSEDSFNTFDSINKKKIRFFPMKNADGSIQPNAYVFAFEEFNSGYDSNDVVGIIRNVKPAPAGAEIGTANLDRASLNPALLTFNRIQQQPPDPVSDGMGGTIQPPNNVVHDRAKVRIFNSGDAALTISSLVLSNTNSFALVNPPAAGTVISAGGSIDVEVQFIATSARIKTGTLTINSTDVDEPATAIKLVGYWQNKSENNEEPTPQEFMTLFGYGTTIANEGETVNQGGLINRIGDEVLSAYWKRADAGAGVEVVQLAAYHSQGNTATVRWHYQGSSSTTTVFVHAGADGQSVLPHLNGSSTQVAAGTFKPATQGSETNPAFGFRVDGEWSDPSRNVQEQGGGNYGHHIRFWVARDAAGKIIPDAYIMGMDYQGINYDYQDNLYLVRNIKPVTAPAAPASLTAIDFGGGIALEWNDSAVPNLAGYNVYRGSASNFTPSSANKLNTGGLLSTSHYNDLFAPVGTTSYYKVTTVDTSGNESTVSSADAVRTTDVTAPSAPTGLAVSDSPAGVVLNWDDNTEPDVAGYSVLRATDAGGPFTQLNGGGLLGTSDYVDSTALPGGTYFYQVVAVDQSSNISAVTGGSVTRGAIPAAPASVTAAPITSNSVLVFWTASPTATTYRVERRVAGAANFDEIAAGVAGVEYLDEGALPDTKYEYRVRAENNTGLSTYSPLGSAMTPPLPVVLPDAPTALTATATTATRVDLTWTGSANGAAAAYRIERRIAGGSFAEIATGITSTAFSDFTAMPQSVYEYRVRAESPAGLSGYSNGAPAFTPPGDVAPVIPPTLSLSDVTVAEPVVGTTEALFTITLSSPPEAAITLAYATADGSAVAGSDYTAASGALVFNPGETVKTVPVEVLSDFVEGESNQTFLLNLSLVSGDVILSDAQAVGTIVDSNAPVAELPVGGKTKATFPGADGKPVTVSMKGVGSAVVSVLADGSAAMMVSGTTNKSVLTLKGVANIARLTVAGSVRSINGKGATLLGDLAVSGSLTTLVLGNVSGGHSISVGSGSSLAITLGSVSDLNLFSASPIKTLKAVEWLDTATGDQITAPAIGSVTIQRDFMADLSTGTLSKLTIGGVARDMTLRATDNIGTVRAASMVSSEVFAGANPAAVSLPTAMSELANPAAGVKSVSVTSKSAGAFSNSLIAAGQIGKLALGALATGNAQVFFGAAADQISSVTGSTGAGKLKLSKLADPSQSVADNDFLIRIL